MVTSNYIRTRDYTSEQAPYLQLYNNIADKTRVRRKMCRNPSRPEWISGNQMGQEDYADRTLEKIIYLSTHIQYIRSHERFSEVVIQFGIL